MPSDLIEQRRAAARASITECNGIGEKLIVELKALRPLNLRPAPARELPEAELTETTLAYERMRRLAALMGDRSPIAYYRAATECHEKLVAELKQFAAVADDMAYEIGERLHVLKRAKPPGVQWAAYLKDVGMPWGKSRADEFIQVFLGKVTVLQLKEKNAEKNRKYRAEQPSRDGRPIIDSKRKNSKASACDIDWEHYQEDGEADAQARARAVEWQLHEVIRILGDEFALRRRGAKSSEWKAKVVKQLATIKRLATKLHAEGLAHHTGRRQPTED
jgi:hypothetical protein